MCHPYEDLTDETGEIYPFNSIFRQQLAHFIQKHGSQLGKTDVTKDVQNKWISEPTLQIKLHHSNMPLITQHGNERLSHKVHLIKWSTQCLESCKHVKYGV